MEEVTRETHSLPCDVSTGKPRSIMEANGLSDGMRIDSNMWKPPRAFVLSTAWPSYTTMYTKAMPSPPSPPAVELSTVQLVFYLVERWWTSSLTSRPLLGCL